MEKEIRNRIEDRGYFVMRLRNSGYPCDDMVTAFPEKDRRKWMVVVGRGHNNLIITCYKNGTLDFYDGYQFFNEKLKYKLQTDSMEVIVEMLNDKGIVHKHPSYGRPTTEEETCIETKESE